MASAVPIVPPAPAADVRAASAVAQTLAHLIADEHARLLDPAVPSVVGDVEVCATLASAVCEIWPALPRPLVGQTLANALTEQPLSTIRVRHWLALVLAATDEDRRALRGVALPAPDAQPGWLWPAIDAAFAARWPSAYVAGGLLALGATDRSATLPQAWAPVFARLPHLGTMLPAARRHEVTDPTGQFGALPTTPLAFMPSGRVAQVLVVDPHAGLAVWVDAAGDPTWAPQVLPRLPSIRVVGPLAAPPDRFGPAPTTNVALRFLFAPTLGLDRAAGLAEQCARAIREAARAEGAPLVSPFRGRQLPAEWLAALPGVPLWRNGDPDLVPARAPVRAIPLAHASTASAPSAAPTALSDGMRALAARMLRRASGRVGESPEIAGPVSPSAPSAA